MLKKPLLTGVLLLIFYSLALNLPFLGERELQGEAARRVVVALEMLERGDFIVPHVEGEVYLRKPPFYNWILAGLFALTGQTSEKIARLSSVLAATLAALLLALVFRAVIPSSGWEFLLPGLVFLTLPEVMDKAVRAEIDMTYTLLVTASLFSWFYLHELRGHRGAAWMLSMALLGLATLTKTFQALAFFYAGVAPYLFFKRRLKDFFSWPHFIGGLIFLLIFGLWFALAAERIGAQNILKAWFAEYLGKKKPLEPSGFWGHFLRFPLEYIQGHLPWILFLLGWLDRSWRDSLSSREKSLALFSLCLLAFSFPIYWFLPGARLRYLLPAVGGLTMLIALPLYHGLLRDAFPRKITWPLKGLFLLLAGGVPFLIASGWERLHLQDNLLAVFSLLALIPLALFFLRTQRAQTQIFLLMLFLWMAKFSFAATYFTYQDKFRSHYRSAALKLREWLPPGATLCDYRVNTPHITYYLRYRFHWVKEVRLVKRSRDLSECTYVLAWRNRPPGEGFVKVADLQARRRQWTLWRKVR